MGEQTSIPCSREARDAHAAQKPDDVSWTDYLLALADEREIATVDPDLERIEATLATLEERTGRIERTLEEVTGR